MPDHAEHVAHPPLNLVSAMTSGDGADMWGVGFDADIDAVVRGSRSGNVGNAVAERGPSAVERQ